MGQATSLKIPGDLVVDDVITNVTSHTSNEPTPYESFRTGASEILNST